MKEKDYSIEMMRSLGCFFVVVIHVCASYFLEWAQISKTQWLVIDIFSSLARFSVPAFIMISGTLILNKECSIKKSIKRVVKLIIIILMSSLFYLIIVNIMLNNEKIDIKSCIVLILQSDVSYHLWYLYMLIGLYLLAPIISKVVKIGDDKLYKYYIFLVLLFSATLLIPDTSQILLGRKISLCLPFEGIGAYIGCFVIGYYLYNINKINKKGFKIAIQGFILINAMTIIMTYLLTIMSGNPNQTFLDRNCINSILSAMFIFYIIRYIFINFRINKNIIKAVAFIGKLSLIVYIIHPFIIILYSKFMKEKINNFIDNFYINFILELLIVFIGSLIVSYITSSLVKITQSIQKTIGSYLRYKNI